MFVLLFKNLSRLSQSLCQPFTKHLIVSFWLNFLTACHFFDIFGRYPARQQQANSHHPSAAGRAVRGARHPAAIPNAYSVNTLLLPNQQKKKVAT